MRRLAVRLGSSVLAIATIVSIVLFGGALFGGGVAAAQAIRAAALAPQFKATASTPELRDKFHDSVVKGLQGLSGPGGPNGELGEVLSAADARQRLGEDLLSCGGQATCLPRALAALKANRVVATDVSVSGKSYTISLRLYDGQGHELTHAEDLCEICTVHEAEDAVTKAATRLAAASRTFPIEPAPGVAAEEHKKKEEPKPVAPPPPTSTTSPMQEAPPPPPVAARERRHFPWRPVAFASLAVGVIGLAVGIPLIVIDGRPTCDAADPTHQCPEVYNTLGGGAAMVTIGALGVAAAAPLFYFDWRDRRRPVTALQLLGAPTAGGGALTLQGRF